MRNWSIKKKMLISILVSTIFLVLIVTSVTSLISYKTMRNQLISDRRTGILWLQSRLTLETNKYLNQFYRFEIDKNIRNAIVQWSNGTPDLYSMNQLKVISDLNTVINMNNEINYIEIISPFRSQILHASRSGAKLIEADDQFEYLLNRPKDFQKNIIFKNEDNNIILFHEMRSFPNKELLAVIKIAIWPYNFQKILSNIKSSTDESILLYNDENQPILSDWGNVEKNIDNPEIILQTLESQEKLEDFYNGNFCFRQNVSGGKLKILFLVPNEGINASLKYIILADCIICILAIVISVIVSIIYSGYFTKPIIDLSAHMKNITIDSANIIPEHKTRGDEIGALQESFNIMIEKNRKLLAEEYQSNLEKREAQIRALQAQINPHFLYNTLQVIGGLALKNNGSKIYLMTTSLGDILRYSLNFTNEMVCLSEEIQYLEGYLIIQNERFDNKINIKIYSDDNAMECLIPKLILQPLVENSLEHGFKGKQGNWQIDLFARITFDNDLEIIVSDNGLGIPDNKLISIIQSLDNGTSEPLNANAHIGLANVNARIRLKYSEIKYGITIESEEMKGTQVKLLTKAIRKESHEI